MARKQSRRILTLAAAVIVGGGLGAAFWPQPLPVDIGTVTSGAMMVTVDEEARTRVRDAYIVSAPITGRLQRVELEPGDEVMRGETVVARMLPINPDALDVRSREQVRAAISAAEAALRASEADLNSALAERDLARADAERARKLYAQGNTSQAALERAESQYRRVEAAVDTARAAISMRIADLKSAEAQLITLDTGGLSQGGTDGLTAVEIPAPVTGRILRVMQQSETTLPAGAPILEIGDTRGDLEVIVELLSTDAVKVAPGDRVIITNWGGVEDLSGVVERVDPWGFTKYSALGVEEQRVNAVVQFTDPPETRGSLGHGFRVETRIVVWESDGAVTAPSSALFRDNGAWAVFVSKDGRAVKRAVTPGRNNGLSAEVLDGLQPGETLVLFPAAGLSDGDRITPRNGG